MDWWLIILVIFSSLILLMASGMPVAFAFLLISLSTAGIMWGGFSGLRQVILSMEASITTFILLPIPLFVLMGEILFHSGMGIRAIDVLDKWMGQMPGRLGLLAVVSGTLFASLTGTSMGSVAMLGSVLVPEMERRGYKKSMSLGPILGSGGLAILIPPTSLGVLVASLGQFSVGRLLMAIIFPALVMATLFAFYVILRCRLQPSLAPSYAKEPAPISEKIALTVRYVLPLALVIFLVTGFIFFGIATPSEAAATGAFGSLALAIAYNGLKWEMLKKSIIGTVKIAVFVMFIITGSTVFSQLLAFSGAVSGLMRAVLDIPIAPIFLIIAMQIVVLLLGCLMDQLAIIMITIPIFMPLINALGFDPVWFGTMYLLNMEIATVSPPFGMSLFVMKGVASPDTSMKDIYQASAPFIALEIITMILILVYPPIALWLPNHMLH